MFNESSEARIGVVIRNCKGEIMAALSEKIQKPQSIVALKRQPSLLVNVVFNNPHSREILSL